MEEKQCLEVRYVISYVTGMLTGMYVHTHFIELNYDQYVVFPHCVHGINRSWKTI